MSKAIIAMLISALEYHRTQTRPIHSTDFAIDKAKEYLAQPDAAVHYSMMYTKEDKEIIHNLQRAKFALKQAMEYIDKVHSRNDVFYCDDIEELLSHIDIDLEIMTMDLARG